MSDLNVYQIESVELTGGEESGKELRLKIRTDNKTIKDCNQLYV